MLGHHLLRVSSDLEQGGSKLWGRGHPPFNDPPPPSLPPPPLKLITPPPKVPPTPKKQAVAELFCNLTCHYRWLQICLQTRLQTYQPELSNINYSWSICRRVCRRVYRQVSLKTVFFTLFSHFFELPTYPKPIEG